MPKWKAEGEAQFRAEFHGSAAPLCMRAWLVWCMTSIGCMGCMAYRCTLALGFVSPAVLCMVCSPGPCPTHVSPVPAHIPPHIPDTPFCASHIVVPQAPDLGPGLTPSLLPQEVPCHRESALEVPCHRESTVEVPCHRRIVGMHECAMQSQR